MPLSKKHGYHKAHSANSKAMLHRNKDLIFTLCLFESIRSPLRKTDLVQTKYDFI